MWRFTVDKAAVSLSPSTQKPSLYERRQCQIADAQRDARILRSAPAEPGGQLCQRHHQPPEAGRADRGGRHALSAAQPAEERRTAEV